MWQRFQIQLLDSAQGQALQSWELQDHQVIRIGRAPDNDIVLASQLVSRAHAYLQPEEGSWTLNSLSQQGIFVEGERQDSVVLKSGMAFRLAAKGPFLRFEGIARATDDDHSTISVTPDEAPVFLLDRAERDRHVEAIVQGDYFHNLKSRAEELRKRRNPNT